MRRSQYVLQKMIGEKCYLSPISVEDAEQYTEWLNDYEITQYLTLASMQISLLIDYAFSVLNLHNIMLRVYAFNERAKRSYESVGFKMIGKRRNALIRNRITYDMYLMDLLPEDFYSKKDK